MSEATLEAPLPIRTARLALAPTGGRPGLVEALLREQQTLTAVDRFAERHASGTVPAQARYYRELLPSARPDVGQQYAFEVDLDACTGCKACVAGCHSLNGLDGPEVWRTVGLLHGGTVEAPVQQTVTTSCHHCVDPGCLSGCPTKAYEKDPATGIVKHLDDQCFGCQYCTLMCPYDAPKYDARRGIVRKCDMCSDRLVAGEAPACVQACPNQAIRITVVDQVDAVRTARTGAFLPGAPAPDHTLPSTVYKTRRESAGSLLPADFYRTGPEHAHPPLVVMLTLTQLSVGAFLVDAVARRWLGSGHALAQALFALAVAAVALGASVFHLGRPQLFYRAVLGWRTSWLSREILVFGAFAKLGALYALCVAAPFLPGLAWLAKVAPLVQVATAATGLAGIAASTMVYAATRRPHWGVRYTAPRFVLTALVLGIAAVAAVGLVAAAVAGTPASFVWALLPLVVAVTLVKLGFEALVLRHRRAPAHTVMRRMATLLTTDLARVTVGRFVMAGAGGILIPLALLAGSPHVGGAALDPGSAVGAVVMLLLLLGGELSERYLFFAAAPASRMPGGLR